jgi:hypothetical protein
MPFQVTEVQKHLKGVDDPATREELASQAERNGAAQSWSRHSATWAGIPSTDPTPS